MPTILQVKQIRQELNFKTTTGFTLLFLTLLWYFTLVFWYLFDIFDMTLKFAVKVTNERKIIRKCYVWVLSFYVKLRQKPPSEPHCIYVVKVVVIAATG